MLFRGTQPDPPLFAILIFAKAAGVPMKTFRYINFSNYRNIRTFQTGLVSLLEPSQSLQV